MNLCCVGLKKYALFVQHYEVWGFIKEFHFLSRKSAAVCCIKTSGPQGEVTNLLPLFHLRILWRTSVGRARPEAFTALCHSGSGSRRFGRTYWRHFQGKRVPQVWTLTAKMKSPGRNKGSKKIEALHRVSVFCSWYKPRDNMQSYSQDNFCPDCTSGILVSLVLKAKGPGS